MSDETTLQILNGLAGVAALVNGLLLWPVVRRLSRLEPRVERLESANEARKKRGKKRAVK